MYGYTEKIGFSRGHRNRKPISEFCPGVPLPSDDEAKRLQRIRSDEDAQACDRIIDKYKTLIRLSWGRYEAA